MICFTRPICPDSEDVGTKQENLRCASAESESSMRHTEYHGQTLSAVEIARCPQLRAYRPRPHFHTIESLATQYFRHAPKMSIKSLLPNHHQCATTAARDIAMCWPQVRSHRLSKDPVVAAAAVYQMLLAWPVFDAAFLFGCILCWQCVAYASHSLQILRVVQHHGLEYQYSWSITICFSR